MKQLIQGGGPMAFNKPGLDTTAMFKGSQPTDQVTNDNEGGSFPES